MLIQKNQFSTKEFPVGVLNFIFRLQKRGNVQFCLNFNDDISLSELLHIALPHRVEYVRMKNTTAQTLNVFVSN